MRLLTDVTLAMLVATVVWAVFYFGPTLLDAIFDPYADRFEDVDELAERDRP